MTVKELAARLAELPNDEAEVLVEVPDPNSVIPDEYAIKAVTFVDWPEHFRIKDNLTGKIANFAKPLAYIKV